MATAPSKLKSEPVTDTRDIIMAVLGTSSRAQVEIKRQEVKREDICDGPLQDGYSTNQRQALG